MYLEELLRVIKRNDERFLRSLLAYALGRERAEHQQQHNS